MTTWQKYPLLSAEEERQLAVRIAAGDQDARQHMILCNVRLVYLFAQKYPRTGVNFDDFIQEGILGLIHAVKKYDGRGRFSTYAYFWITQALLRSLDRLEQTVALPMYRREQLRRLSTIFQRAEQAGDGEPTPEHCAKALNLPLEQIHVLFECHRQRQTLSLDVTLSEDGYIAGKDCLADPAGSVSREHSLLQDALEACTEREQDVLRRRYSEGKSQREIAQELHVTHQRICQIEKQALTKMRRFLQ